MNRIREMISSVLIGLILTSCFNGEVINDKELKKTYYPNGEIMTEEWFKHDTIKDGRFKMYYENGTTKMIIDYKDNVREGIEQSYYSNGQLEYECYNKSGQRDSVSTDYYQNGTLKNKYNYFNGVAFGSQYSYDSLGNILSYYFNDLEGQTVFRQDYSSNNNYGTPIYFIYNKSQLSTKETFESLIYLAIPEHYSDFTFNLSEYDNKGLRKDFNEEELTSSYSKLHYAHTYSIDRKYDLEGEYRLEMRLSLLDSVNNQTITDTADFIIYVK